MAAPYPGPVQVGSYFVGQYYQVLQQQPDVVHQFYHNSSSMIRIDGDSSVTASEMLQIHSLVMSLNFTAIEIKTINSLGSWNGGVLVMVSGSVKTKEFSGRRKFVQTFFLAPQDKGYFVLNDIFQFVEEDVVTYQQHQPPVLSENEYEAQLNASSPLPEQTVSDYGLEEEAAEYVNSVHIEDDPVDKYSLPDQQQEEDPEDEFVVEETPAQETPTSVQTDSNTVREPVQTDFNTMREPDQTDFNIVREPPITAVEEPVGEPQKKTYASILRVAKNQYASSAATQPSYKTSAPAASDWNYTPEPTAQQPNYASSYAPESRTSSYAPEYGVEAAEGSSFLEEGEVKSVYVRNLPSTITAAELEQEFKNFGRIKRDGVFVRNRKDVLGVCYAFVEFEDVSGVQNAIQASPIQLDGRQVYIEERRPNSSATSRGGRSGRGRGRGSYQTDSSRGRYGGGRSSGWGSSQDGDYNRVKSNGYYQ